jgi:hypothetical protein
VSSIIQDDAGGKPSLRFYCGGLPADEAIDASGHEPNGYFWEGVLAFLDPPLVDSLELDSEAGMFAAYGDGDQLSRVRSHLEPLLSDPEAISALIARAEAAGHDFDD